MTKATKNNGVPFAKAPAAKEVLPTIKSWEGAWKALDGAFAGVDKAQAGVQLTLKGVAAFLTDKYGPDCFANPKSEAAKIFRDQNNAHFDPLIDKAPEAEKGKYRSQKKTTYGRVRLYAAKAWIAAGKTLSQLERAEADKVIATYDGKAKAPGAKANEARSWKARMTEELTALYKFDAKCTDRGGVGEQARASVIGGIEAALKTLGVNTAKLLEEIEA